LNNTQSSNVKDQATILASSDEIDRAAKNMKDKAVVTDKNGTINKLAMKETGDTILKYLATKGKLPIHAAIETAMPEVKNIVALFRNRFALSRFGAIHFVMRGVNIIMLAIDANDNWNPASKSVLGSYKRIANPAAERMFSGSESLPITYPTVKNANIITARTIGGFAPVANA
jgi:hypothetical protein